MNALKEADPDAPDDGVGARMKDALVINAQARLAGTRWLPALL